MGTIRKNGDAFFALVFAAIAWYFINRFFHSWPGLFHFALPKEISKFTWQPWYGWAILIGIAVLIGLIPALRGYIGSMRKNLLRRPK